ncbi:DUF1206 domain-containing protein [Roseivirga sp. BDSF3-8]|uniref:DUF1206 domain-containing protein n=1 Tax=Roseivirga sp. BDSF3-8 TaxID=3241598 RepID=UPI003532600B
MASISHAAPSPDDKWVENFARFGYIAKGAVYVMIGGLTVAAAFNYGGQKAGKMTVFKFIDGVPGGSILLGILALGLLAYAVWRFVQASRDTENEGSDAKGIAKRLGYLVSGIMYGFLSYYAVRLIVKTGGGGSGGSRETLVAKLLSQPFGQWLVGIVALFFIVKGVRQIIKAYTGSFKKKVQQSSISADKKRLFTKWGRLGYYSRGVILLIVGYMFVKAALQANPSQAGGTQEAFGYLQSTSYGPWLMALIAIGLIGYGIFTFIKARYRTMSGINWR